MKIQGFNHVTIKIRDLNESLRFYVDVLGMELIHRGTNDVYLEWGSAWVCLIEKTKLKKREQEQLGVDHVAFSISEEDFQEAVEKLKAKDVPIIRCPVKRGQGWSVNFLDPDGTQFELHTSNLKERMKVWK